MALTHPEYAHGISDAELVKEAIQFCDEELDSYDGTEYDDDSEVCCQRSNTFIRELVRRVELLSSDRYNAEAVRVIAEIKKVDSGDPALMGIEEQVSESGGRWQPCTGCYDTEDGHPTQNYDYSPALQTPIGCGCHECGGLGAVWWYMSEQDVADWEKVCESADLEGELLDVLKSIKRHGELACVEANPGYHTGGKKPATKDVFQFPRHMLTQLDQAIAKAEARS